MSSRRAVKGAILLAPLLVSVLALHAWGDAASAGLGRAVGLWQYPERTHGVFQIRVPRRSDADGFASKALNDFVTGAVKAHGAALSLIHPIQRVKVVLFEDVRELRRFGWSAAEHLKENEGLFDPASRTIFVRMQQQLQRDPVIAALQRGAARLLLHDAGSDRWEPWLAEGLAGRLEGAAAGTSTWTGDPPITLRELRSARPADFEGRTGPAYGRAARLLVAYLTERRPEEFSRYYNALRRGAPDPRELFEEKFFSPSSLEHDWREWTRSLK